MSVDSFDFRVMRTRIIHERNNNNNKKKNSFLQKGREKPLHLFAVFHIIFPLQI